MTYECIFAEELSSNIAQGDRLNRNLPPGITPTDSGS